MLPDARSMSIYLGPNGEQVAKELTPTDTEIDFD